MITWQVILTAFVLPILLKVIEIVLPRFIKDREKVRELREKIEAKREELEDKQRKVNRPATRDELSKRLRDGDF